MLRQHPHEDDTTTTDGHFFDFARFLAAVGYDPTRRKRAAGFRSDLIAQAAKVTRSQGRSRRLTIDSRMGQTNQ